MKAFMKQVRMAVLRQGLKRGEIVELMRKSCANRDWLKVREDSNEGGKKVRRGGMR